MTRWSVCFVALLAVGCAQKREYQVVVHNRLDMPVTVGLIKDGPPVEAGWLTVEQTSMTGPRDLVGPWGMVIPEGKSADSPKLRGSFAGRTQALLRVYRGQHSNSELMAISEGSQSRATATLLPGYNEVEVVPGDRSLMMVRRIGR
jgi:hypothetical protein